LVWNYLGLRETERVDDLIGESRMQRMAVLTTMAFHKPKLLNDERLALNARVRSLMLTGNETADPEELRAHGRRMIEEIEQSGVFDDAPRAQIPAGAPN
jgi:hypothetical protein